MAVGKDKSRAFRSSLVTEVSKERQACAKNSKAAWALGGVTNVHSYVALVAVLGSAMAFKGHHRIKQASRRSRILGANGTRMYIGG